MSSPYHAIPDHVRWMWFWILLVVTLGLMVVLIAAGSNLSNDQAPWGIVSFELAGSVEKAGAILTSWDQAARISAAFNLGLDYVFMLAYATAIGLGSTLAAGVLENRGWPLAELGAWLSWGIILAALCDAIENWALLKVLYSSPGPGMLPAAWPALARICALIKFGLVFIGLVYVFYAGVVWLVQRTETKS